MTNDEVIKAWTNGCFAQTSTLSSDGRYLRSYRAIIGDNRNGFRVTDQRYSVTTTRHTNAAAAAAALLGVVTFTTL
jgi:hypothetical protein